MIKHDTLLLAMFPAIIAIILEMLNPLSNNVVERQAEEAVRKHKLAPNSPEVMKNFALGAISVAGLAPTLMSVITAALAILHDIPAAYVFWWLYVVLLVGVFIALWIGREIGNGEFYDYETSYVTLFGLPLITYSKLHSVYIYGLNLLLIGLCWILWRL